MSVGKTLTTLKCCFLEVIEQNIRGIEDDSPLTVPDFIYPSVSGGFPACPDSSYLTAWVDPTRGVGRATPRSAGELVQTDRHATRKMASIWVAWGIPCTVNMRSPVEASGCGDVVGSCTNFEHPGTHAHDSYRADLAMDVITGVPAAVKKCFCSKSHPDDPTLNLICDKPVFQLAQVIESPLRLTAKVQFQVLL